MSGSQSRAGIPHRVYPSASGACNPPHVVSQFSILRLRRTSSRGRVLVAHSTTCVSWNLVLTPAPTAQPSLSPSLPGQETPLDKRLLSVPGHREPLPGAQPQRSPPCALPTCRELGVPAPLTTSWNPPASSKGIAPPLSPGPSPDWWECGSLWPPTRGPAPRAGSGSASSLTHSSCSSPRGERGEVLGKVLGPGGEIAAPTRGARQRGCSARRSARGCGPSVRPRVAVSSPVSCGWGGNCQPGIAGGTQRKPGSPPAGSVDEPRSRAPGTRRRAARR